MPATDRPVPRLVLASASGVDEAAVGATLAAPTPASLALVLAVAKCGAVAAELRPAVPTLVVGCDSVLELDGESHGKPADAAEAVTRWRRMRGRTGVLHTGHCVRLLAGGQRAETGVGAGERRAVASTLVRFADVSDSEIEAYVATGEPSTVAGAFTLDGFGGAYVRGVDGDPHAVVGISLPLLRDLVADLGTQWHALWARPT